MKRKQLIWDFIVQRLLSTPDVAARLGIGLSTLRRMVQSGDFIEPLRLSERRVAYIESDIDDWIESRKRSPQAQRST